MTITTVTARNTFDGNDVTTGFNTDYQFFNASDLVVTLVVDATGVETPQVLTTDYTVSGGAVNNAPATGTITMIVAPATGETLVVERKQPLTQALIDLLTGGKFPASTIEAGYDRVTLLVQQIKDDINRAVQLPIATNPTAAALIIPLPVADEVLVGNAGATGWENRDLLSASATSALPITKGGTGSVTAAAARAALAVPGLAVTNTFTGAQIVGTPTGGGQGAGTVNAVALFDDGKLALHGGLNTLTETLIFDDNGQVFFDLRRTDAHAASASLSTRRTFGQNDAPTNIQFGSLGVNSSVITAGLESGLALVRTVQSGSLITRVEVAAGMIIGAPTGGDKGVGTLNLNEDLYKDGTKVVGARVTGWGAATGTATRTTFVTSTVTLEQLAERVKAVIDDAIAHGLIGT